jgi:hypothetical protein
LKAAWLEITMVVIREAMMVIREAMMVIREAMMQLIQWSQIHLMEVISAQVSLLLSQTLAPNTIAPPFKKCTNILRKE